MNFKNQVAHWAKTNLENLNIVVIYNVIDNSPIQFVKQGLGCFLTTNDLFDSYAEEAVSVRTSNSYKSCFSVEEEY